MSNAELKERLTPSLTLLMIPGIGRGRYRSLVRAFGSPEAVLTASVSRLEQVRGISRSIASQIQAEQDASAAAVVAAKIVQMGWQVMFRGDDGYPESLATIDDAPPILFATGKPFSPEEPSVAIVGTRHPTEAGRLFTVDLARALAETGVTVVSGMAEGIDSAAHRGCLEAGGRTVAVWGSSLEIVFPPSNRRLASSIKERGTVCSEYLPGTHPDRGTFPERNRIIAGLSAGVVVIEAGQKSGALITADRALAQGRQLFAVPGRPGAAMSIGTNGLIRNGARLLTSAEDIFDELPRLRGEVTSRRFQGLPELTEAETSLVGKLKEGPVHLDKLAREMEMASQELMELLLALELKNVVRELSGKRYGLSDGAT